MEYLSIGRPAKKLVNICGATYVPGKHIGRVSFGSTQGQRPIASQAAPDTIKNRTLSNHTNWLQRWQSANIDYDTG